MRIKAYACIIIIIYFCDIYDNFNIIYLIAFFQKINNLNKDLVYIYINGIFIFKVIYGD